MPENFITFTYNTVILIYTKHNTTKETSTGLTVITQQDL